MDVITETSLEALLQRATDCRNKNPDTAAIVAFCGIIKKEPDGPSIASKLIASKIQSPQEWEALQGLTVLDSCMKNCGSSFQSEIGKFRFLNEMIKLVSPKFLGSRTPTSVRNQVLKMLYNWTVDYPKEHKIKEAYDMLVRQGVIPKDDVPLEEEPKMPVPQVQERPNAIFQDEEKVRLLQKLLRSKKPDDLQAANKLIKTMVKEDERRVEIKSKKISEVETVRNNVRLLSEMLDSYQRDLTSSDELELIKELYQGCGRLKPNIIKLASEAQDSHEFLHEVLSVGDELNQVLERYKETVVVDKKSKDGVSKSQKEVSVLLDLSTPDEELAPASSQKGVCCPDLFSEPLPTSGLKLDDPISDILSSSISLNLEGEKKGKSVSTADSIFTSLGSPTRNAGGSSTPVECQQAKEKSPTEKNNKLKALQELDALGESLLQQCKINAVTKNSTKEVVEDVAGEEKAEGTCGDESTKNASTVEDDVLMVLSDEKNGLDDPSSAVIPGESHPSKVEVKPLTDVSVSLESIKPSSIPPINVIEEKNGISVTIHVAKDAPRDDVTVFVVTTLSKNPSPLKNYLFQAVVPKGCKLKLQPASGSELPAHSPFLPPSAITQIMLIANPNNLDVGLKCMISYVMDDETITEMGEVERLPSTT